MIPAPPVTEVMCHRVAMQSASRPAPTWRPTIIGALVAGALIVASFLVGAMLGHGGLPALLVVGLPCLLGGVIAFTRPQLRPFAAGFLVAWGSTVIIVILIYVLLVVALAGGTAG